MSYIIAQPSIPLPRHPVSKDSLSPFLDHKPPWEGIHCALGFDSSALKFKELLVTLVVASTSNPLESGTNPALIVRGGSNNRVCQLSCALNPPYPEHSRVAVKCVCSGFCLHTEAVHRTLCPMLLFKTPHIFPFVLDKGLGSMCTCLLPLLSLPFGSNESSFKPSQAVTWSLRKNLAPSLASLPPSWRTEPRPGKESRSPPCRSPDPTLAEPQQTQIHPTLDWHPDANLKRV